MRKPITTIAITAICSLAALLATATTSLAQAGSTGGTLGKTGKSASGGEEAVQRPRTSAPKSSAGLPPERAGSSCAKAIGVWYWVTMEVTIKPDGVAESPGGNG